MLVLSKQCCLFHWLSQHLAFQTQTVRQEATAREGEGGGEGSSLFLPILWFSKSRAQHEPHFVTPPGLPFCCSVCNKRGKKDVFANISFLAQHPESLSPWVSGQVPTQCIRYRMKWGSHESLPKSQTSVKPPCFRHSVLKGLSLSPYPHSRASPVSLLQHLTISLHSLWQQWAGLWGGCAPEKPHREM